MQVQAAARLKPMTRAKELRIAQHNGSGELSVVEQRLRPIEVGEDGIEQASALNQSHFQRSPFIRIDQDRHEIQVPWPIRVGRPRVAPVRQAVLVQQPFGEPPAPGEFAVGHVG